jgi:putative peptidoglycan lipid II flippase
VLLAAWAGAAVLIAAAVPVSRFFAQIQPGGLGAEQMARALAAFAPGLVGYALIAHLGRALYARGLSRASAGATVAGWLAVIVIDVALVLAVPGDWVVAALGLGNTLGMDLAGALLVWHIRRAAGRAAVQGTGRAALAGLAGCVLGGAAGWFVAAAIGDVPVLATVGTAVLAAAVAAVAFGAAALVFAGSDVRLVLDRRLRRG